MTDFFERLGLPRRFAVDPAALERAYLSRSRAVHPDFHAGGADADLAASLEVSAALNEAYTTLKDPVRRAEYLLALEGGPSAQQERNVHASFLEEMMEYRERIESLPPDDDGYSIRGELEERENDYETWVVGEFDRYETLPPDHPDRPKHLLNVRQSLNALKTIRSLLRGLPAGDG